MSAASFPPPAETPEIELVSMEPADVPAVAALERLSFTHPWSDELFLQEVRLPYSKVLLARPTVGGDPRVVAYICRWLLEGELHILNVAVHPAWRRRSIGRRLVQAVLVEARDAAAGRATLEVRRHNHAARSLYQGLGFSPVGVRQGYYGPGEDALVLELLLDGGRA